jgi:hypothetical protein
MNITYLHLSNYLTNYLSTLILFIYILAMLHVYLWITIYNLISWFDLIFLDI